MSRTLWLSPIPPDRTDIAQYSLRVVPHLASLMDLDVVSSANMARAVQGFEAKDATLLSYPLESLSSRDLNASKFCMYNIGNNPLFHAKILRTGMLHPGIVILHDRSLQDLCYAVLDETRTGVDIAGSYLSAMSQWYGRSGREAARSALAGESLVSDLAANFPLFEVALQNALGAVTHNPEIAAEITERFPGMPVATLHLPYGSAAPSASGPPELRSDQPIRLAMFGYLGPNRRLCAFLRTWALSPWKHRFELDLAGEMINSSEVEAVIAETGLRDQIRSHGFLPDDQLDALIGTTHLVLNLRNPTMGEASGSQLRIWANGAASVISDTGWYSALPKGSVLRVSIEREAQDLLTLLADLALGRVDLDAVARRGAESLAASDPALYALALSEWLERQRESIFVGWAEKALVETIARTYARCTPRGLAPKMPPRLIG